MNTRCFEGKERLILEIKSFLLYSLLDWSSVFNSFSCSNLLDMLDHCNLQAYTSGLPGYLD